MAPGGKPSCLTTLPAVRHCQSQCEPTDSQTHLQSGGDLRCPDLGQSAWETGSLSEAVWGASPIPAAQPVALFARLATRRVGGRHAK